MAANVAAYPTPTCPFGSDAVVIVTVPAAIVNVKLALFDTVGDSESVTCAVIVKLPDAVGVPLSAPVPPFSVTPVGNAPAVMDQLYGVVPPVAASVPEYAVPTVPLGRDVVLIASPGGAIVNVKLALFKTAGDSESLTCAVTVKLPEAVGVPLSAPVAEFSVTPAGNAPDVILQE